MLIETRSIEAPCTWTEVSGANPRAAPRHYRGAESQRRPAPQGPDRCGRAGAGLRSFQAAGPVRARWRSFERSRTEVGGAGLQEGGVVHRAEPDRERAESRCSPAAGAGLREGGARLREGEAMRRAELNRGRAEPCAGQSRTAGGRSRAAPRRLEPDRGPAAGEVPDQGGHEAGPWAEAGLPTGGVGVDGLHMSRSRAASGPEWMGGAPVAGARHVASVPREVQKWSGRTGRRFLKLGLPRA